MTTDERTSYILAVSHSGSGDIRTYRLNGAANALDGIETVKLSEDAAEHAMSVPMVLLPKRRVLLAGLRGGASPVLAFGVDPATGALKRIGRSRLQGSAPYLSTDADERFLLSVINPGESAFVQKLGPDGVPEPEPTSTSTGIPKAHSLLELNGFVYVAGCDQPAIFQFALGDDGTLTPLATPQAPGTGNDDFRHMAITPDKRSLYVISEAAGSLTHFAIDPQSGQLIHRESVPLADDVCAAADIAIVNGGRHVITSERKRSTLSVVALGEGGSIGRPVTIETEPSPRAMAASPDGRHLFVAGEESNAVAIYAISPDDGTLTLNGRTVVGTRPNWITIIPVSG